MILSTDTGSVRARATASAAGAASGASGAAFKSRVSRDTILYSRADAVVGRLVQRAERAKHAVGVYDDGAGAGGAAGSSGAALNPRVSTDTILHSPQSTVNTINWEDLQQRGTRVPAFETPEGSLSGGSPSGGISVSRLTQSLLDVFKFEKMWDEEDCVGTDAQNPALNWPEWDAHVQPRKDSLKIPGRRRSSIMPRIQNPEQYARRLSPEVGRERNSIMIRNPEQSWRSCPEPGRRRSSIIIHNPEQQSLRLK
jgi:hypothetical protein